MCGIAGIVHLDGRPVDRKILDRMTDALSHRGPDGRGIFLDGNVGLGHRRLKIIDLSDAAAQPMSSEDGEIQVVFNGEIYNFLDERRRLERQGRRFHSRSDTEVLLHLYCTEGKQCLQRLRGMFAFAIYDRRRRLLFCARDRLGKKPFKYSFDGRTFLFASELKALREHPACSREVDEVALHHFLTMTYLPAPWTGLRGVEKLEAAHALTLDLQAGKLMKERYWTLDFSQKEERSEEEWRQRLLEKIEECVRMRMVADVPIGVFLSGGIDSSCVSFFMARNSPTPIRTFSIGRGDAHDELEDAQRIAEIIGSDHHPEVVHPNVPELLPLLVHTYEEPFADPSALPTFLLAQTTRKHVTVALNGDGGDENFAGYLRLPILKFSLFWEHAPSVLHTLVGAGLTLLRTLFPTTLLKRCSHFEETIALPWEQRFLQYNCALSEREKCSLYSHHFLRRLRGVPTSYQWYAEQGAITCPILSSAGQARSNAVTPLEQALAVDFALHLADCLLPKVDLASMAYGLECRSPLLDHELVELCARMPLPLKLRGYRTKWILKRALRGVLPEETLRKRKQGFRLPLDHLFRTELRGFLRERLLGGCSKKWQFLDRCHLERFLGAYERTAIDRSGELWTLLWLDEWLAQYT